MGTKFYQCWYQIVPMLAPNFTNVGTKLYQYWHQIVPILASKCTNIGIKLYQYWHQIGSILASKCTNIGIKLYQYCLQMKTTFKLLCSGQLHFLLWKLFVFMLLRLHWSMRRSLYFYRFLFRSLFKLLKPGESRPLPFWPRWVLKLALPNICRWLFPLLVLWP